MFFLFFFEKPGTFCQHFFTKVIWGVELCAASPRGPPHHTPNTHTSTVSKVSSHMRYLRSPIGQPLYDLQHKGFWGFTVSIGQL